MKFREFEGGVVGGVFRPQSFGVNATTFSFGGNALN